MARVKNAVIKKGMTAEEEASSTPSAASDSLRKTLFE
jgi:hypothetical protein